MNRNTVFQESKGKLWWQSQDFSSMVVVTLITACKRSLQRLCFYTCQSFCSQGGVLPLDRGEPPGQTLPPGQTSTWVDTPLDRHTPWADTPMGRYPSGKTPHEHYGIQSTRVPIRVLLECILVLLMVFKRVHRTKRYLVGGRVASPT